MHVVEYHRNIVLFFDGVRFWQALALAGKSALNPVDSARNGTKPIEEFLL
jgi:hypothetical protein